VDSVSHREKNNKKKRNLHGPLGLTLKASHFLPQTIYGFCVVLIKTAIVSRNNVNRLALVMEAQCLFSKKEM
jgi:hypothetical protein